MNNFRKIWNAETNGFIIENKSMNEDYNAFYSAFSERFPDSGVTFTAFKTQVSRLKCGRYGRKDFSKEYDRFILNRKRSVMSE